MRISEQGLDLIKSFEGLRLSAYRDAVGVLTIGYGHTRGVRLGQIITRREAELLLSADLEPIERQLTADLGEDGVLQCQFDALCSFCFNLGIGAYMRSTLRKYVKAGRDTDAGREFGRWVHAGGRVLPGLVRRRRAEAELYAQAGGVTPLFVGVIVMIAMGLAIAFFREMIL